jgi:hypothetical protein
VTNDQEQPIQSMAVYDSMGILSAAARWGEGNALGASLKGWVSRLGDKSVTKVAIDADVRMAFRLGMGGIAKTEDTGGDSVATVALALRDAGTQGAFVREHDPLPTAFGLFLGYGFAATPLHHLLLAGLIERPLDRIESTHVSAGVEYRFDGWLFGRVSYGVFESINRLGVGLGFRFAGFSLDWAYHPYGELGAIQRVSLAYEIPRWSTP